MRIIISDINALIDLRKAALLEALLRLPFEVHVPDLLYEDELLSIPVTEKQALCRQGLRVVGMPGSMIDRALALLRIYPALRLYDCAALALAEGSKDCILLTGDSRLKGFAEQQTIRVHGVLWVFDQIQQHATATMHGLQAALACWQDANTVWLPAAEIQTRLRRLSRGR
jgi:hypothetical protein